MSSNDNIIRGRSSRPGSVQPIQLETPHTAGGPASALASYDSVLEAQRLSYDSSQPPDALKNYRQLSPDSLFPQEGAQAGSLQNPLYDAGSPDFEPPVRQHQYVIPKGKESSVTPKETGINPPRVEHTESNEQAIKAQEPHIQSMLRHYCGDSEDTQLRALELILKHDGKICRIERRPSGGVQSLNTNAVRTFAEHLTHKHLHIPNPFVCFATACGKVFPYIQDRDRHEKQIHKMYRPKAYQALLKSRAREQGGMSPVRPNNPQSPTEFIEYVGPAQVNPHQTATPGAHHSTLPSSKQRTARHRRLKANSGTILRSKTPVPNRQAEPYPRDHARSRSSTPHPSREGDRDISHSIPSNNGIHRAMPGTDDRGGPIITGPKSHRFRTSSPQSRFDGLQERVDGIVEGYHASGGTQTQMSNEHYSAPTTMGSNMISNPPLIDSTMFSSIGYQVPSTSVHVFPQFGSHAPMEPVYEQPKEALTYYGSMPSGMQNRMPPFNTPTRYQHDNHGIYGSAQLQPSHHGYVGQIVYQVQPQQPLHDGSLLYGIFRQNTSISLPPWPRSQNSTTSMSYTTPHPAQMPGHGASSHTTYPPSGGSHVVNPDEHNDQLYYDFLRTSTPNSGPHYTNNSTQQW